LPAAAPAARDFAETFAGAERCGSLREAIASLD
jgi:hypothetical protein